MRVMQIVADATNVIAEGEVLQLLNMHDADVTEEQYLQVIRSKTAKLFEAAAQLGALLAGAAEPEIEAAAEYGRSLGTAFQLIDDVLDYSGNAAEIGKNVGDDLREGKPTLPLIYLMQTRQRRPSANWCAPASRTATSSTSIKSWPRSPPPARSITPGAPPKNRRNRRLIQFPHSQIANSRILC